jgi:uncharacterized membrane protein
MKKYFLTGLLILVPLAITLWVLSLIVTTMDQTLLLLPLSIRKEFPFNVPGSGMLFTLLTILLVGVLARNFVGRRLLLWWEALLTRIPVVSNIYTSVKQVSDTLFSPSGQAFRKAVLVQFPRDGMWSVAFVVGHPGDALSKPLMFPDSPDCVTVYVPTAPNPTSGYVLILPPSEVVDLDISIDEALKFVVSMGVVIPGPKSKFQQLKPLPAK